LQAQEAWRDRMPNRTKQAISKALSVAPKSQEVRRLAKQVDQLERKTDALYERVRQELAAARFLEVNKALGEIESLRGDFAGLSKLKAISSQTGQDYDWSMHNAEKAIESGDLDKAEQLLKKAMATCPDAEFPKRLLGQIQRNKQQARDLIQQIGPLVETAEFEKVARLFAQSSKLWPSNPGLEANRSATKKTRKEFEILIALAKKAQNLGDLDKAIGNAKSALSLCPKSSEAERLIRTVKQDRSRARKQVHGAEALLRKAEFEAARESVREMHEKWPNFQEVQSLWAQIELTAESYHAAINATQQFFEQRKFGQALKECQRALDLCPESEARHLKNRIVSEQSQIAASKGRIRRVIMELLRIPIYLVYGIGCGISKLMSELLPFLGNVVRGSCGVIQGIARALCDLLSDHGLTILKVSFGLAIVAAVGYAAWWLFSDIANFCTVFVIGLLLYGVFHPSESS
jgi:tetratricopeptide (TPR) repeat protein